MPACCSRTALCFACGCGRYPKRCLRQSIASSIRCFYGRPGERAIIYDNERGMGDHRHYGKHEEQYAFKDVDMLIADFLADVRRARGDGE